MSKGIFLLVLSDFNCYCFCFFLLLNLTISYFDLFIFIIFKWCKIFMQLLEKKRFWKRFFYHIQDKKHKNFLNFYIPREYLKQKTKKEKEIVLQCKTIIIS